jgi:hypothetical protein
MRSNALPILYVACGPGRGRDAVYAVLFAVVIAFIVNNRFEMFDQGRLDSVQAGGPGFDLLK